MQVSSLATLVMTELKPPAPSRHPTRKRRQGMRAVVVSCVLILSALPVYSQHQHASAPNVATALHPDLGNYHHPITTKSEEAQKYFDQGLTLLYGFNHDEAARFFRRVAQLDPGAAMAYWGLALSIGPNYNDTAVDAARAASTYEAV